MTLKKCRTGPLRPAGAARIRVVLVDDDDDSRQVVAEVLACAGFEVSGFDSAEAALCSLDRSIPHVVVTDVTLPGIDGYELAARLKKDPRTRSIPIVAMTGLSAPRSAEGKSPFSSYIVKPTSTEALMTVVRRLVPGKVAVATRHA